MAISEREHELISKHIDDVLSEQELIEFNHLNQSSENFRNELLTQEGLIAGLKAHDKTQLKNDINALFTELENKNSSKQRPLWTYAIGIAASISIILVLVFNLQTNDSQGQALFTKYYKPFEVQLATRDLAYAPKGINLYNQKLYQESIPFLTELVKSKENKTAVIFLGIAQLETGNIEKAKKIFLDASQNKNDNFIMQYGEWHLALIYLKLNKTKSAKEILNKISENDGIYQAQSKTILDELD